ncbi:Abi family protein [Pseudomonas sp. KNUC1026]|uniref:Abi family protein n=1 Tax=Pseudomonas sp. KNUC1026 TaxID=2893890 RepID=UPI001F461DDE|nr:Abi family protein [Pseudomonas sp. KNUC1026]UFH49519.1 Abi family protein [Pseudomonas sp. KNUC1026]
MEVADFQRAERKLAQVGCYRLSGFWFPARQFLRSQRGDISLCSITKKPLRQDAFIAGASSDSAFALYLFDKKLRQLMLDAIERI